MRYLPKTQNPENFQENIRKVYNTLDKARIQLQQMIAGLETIGRDDNRQGMIKDAKTLVLLKNQLQGVSQQVAEVSAEYFLRPSKETNL